MIEIATTALPSLFTDLVHKAGTCLSQEIIYIKYNIIMFV